MEYKREKEGEIATMREEYASTTKALHAKVKVGLLYNFVNTKFYTLEESYTQSEEEKKRTIAQLQQLYKEEEKGTMERFERIMDEQIRKVVKMEEQQQKKVRTSSFNKGVFRIVFINKKWKKSPPS